MARLRKYRAAIQWGSRELVIGVFESHSLESAMAEAQARRDRASLEVRPYRSRRNLKNRDRVIQNTGGMRNSIEAEKRARAGRKIPEQLSLLTWRETRRRIIKNGWRRR